MRRRWFGGLVMAAAVAATASGQAAVPFGQGRGNAQGRGSDQGRQPDSAVAVSVQFGFGTRDRELIVSYFSKNPSGLPPGLAKRDDLPPGLAKQLKRNGALPPGLEKKLHPFPVALERQLVTLPLDYKRVMLGAHVLVVNGKTNIVVDFMLDVVK